MASKMLKGLTKPKSAAAKAAARASAASARRRSRLPHRIDVASPELCQKAIDNIDFSMHKNPFIIDMNPGIGLWSQMVYDKVQPCGHVLLEPEEEYHPALKNWAQKHKNVYLTPFSGHNWSTYTTLFSHAPYPYPAFPEDFPGIHPRHHDPKLGLHPDILFIGFNTKPTEADRLVTQFLECIPAQEWIQSFGRVRFLLWIYEKSKERILPATVQSRSRPTLLADTFCDVMPVVTSGIYRTGKGFPSSKTTGNDKTANGRHAVLASPERLRKTWAVKKGETAKSERQIELKGNSPIRQKNLDKKRDTESAWLQRKLAMLTSYTVVPSEHATLEELREMFVRELDNPENSSEARKERRAIQDEWTVSNISKHVSKLPGSYVATEEQLADYLEYERIHLLKGNQMANAYQSIPDEEYSLSINPPLLQIQRDHPPPVTSEKSDFQPKNTLALLDFRPKTLPEFFAHPDQVVRRKRFEVFDWMVRTLFVHRASNLKRALQLLVPGGEHILDEIKDGRGREMGERTVRVLKPEEFIELAEAWEKWEFKPEGFEFEGGTTLGIIEGQPINQEPSL